MTEHAPYVRRAIRAETTAAETRIIADRMRAIGAWGAYFALTEAAGVQRERAARVRKQISADWAAV